MLAYRRVIDAYLDHLRVERRLADLSIDSYARDLQALSAFAAGAGVPIDQLDRRALERFVRCAAHPRAVAAIGRAAGRRGSRVLPLPGPQPSSRRQSRRPAQGAESVAGAAPVSRARGCGCAVVATGRRDGGRTARPRDAGAALCDRHARVGAHRRATRGPASRRRVPDLHRQGQQGAAHPDRGAGRRLDPPLHARGARPDGQRQGAQLSRGYSSTRAAARSRASASGKSSRNTGRKRASGRR